MASPAPSQSVDWEAYFRSFETALAALKIDHAETPRFLGTMLTGLQSLLRDKKVLSLKVDGGFTVTNLILCRGLPWQPLLFPHGLLMLSGQFPSLMSNGPRLARPIPSLNPKKLPLLG
jgi:hypothetical protein